MKNVLTAVAGAFLKKAWLKLLLVILLLAFMRLLLHVLINSPA